MNNFCRFLNNKKGSSLVVVIVVFSVMVVLGSALLTIVSYSHKNSIDSHSQQQAYFTARSAMETVLDTLADITTCGELSQKIMAVPGTTVQGTGSIPNMGDFTVDLTHDATLKKVTVEVTATYYGKTSKLVAVLKEGKGDRLNPIDFLFFSNHSAIEAFSLDNPTPTHIDITGDVFIRGSQDFKNMKLTGDFLSQGTVTSMDPNVHFFGNVFAVGDVAIQYPRTHPDERIIEGSVYSEYDHFNPILIQPNVKGTAIKEPQYGIGFYDNIQYDQMKWNTNFIHPNTPDANHTTLVGMGKSRNDTKQFTLIDGTVFDFFWGGSGPINHNGIVADYAARTLTFPNGVKIEYSPIGVPTNLTIIAESGTGVDKRKFKFDTSTGMVKWFIGENPISGNPIEIDTKPLSGLYVYTNGEVVDPNTFPNFSAGTDIIDNCKFDQTTYASQTIVVDATSKDIYIRVDNTSGDLTLNNVEFEIKGKNKVYLHFQDNKNFTIRNNSKIGVNNDRLRNQLFVVGEKLTMQLNDTSTFIGTAYMNDGEYNEGTIAPPSPVFLKVQGSITASTIKITRGNTYKYLEPDSDPCFDATLPYPTYRRHPPLPPNAINWKIDYYLK